MPTEVLMPELGESVDEATITRWLKKEGDSVQEFEPLLEVNTDKVDTEIPSPASGTLLKILVPENQVVKAGQILCWIGQPDEKIPENGAPDGVSAPVAAAPPVREAEPALARSPSPTGTRAPVVEAAPPAFVVRPGRHERLGFISPVVARLAAEHNLDLSRVSGTGKGGRITKQDVLAYLESRPPERPPAAAAPAPRPHAAPPPIPGEILPLTTMRRAIAEHMVRSKHTSPHVTTVMEADMSRVVAHRQANKEAFARDGVKLTFTPYFIAALVAACKAHPIANSSWSEEGIILHKAVNVGMATALEDKGLIVPVIKNADSLSLLGLARAVNDLADRARRGALQPDEVRDGTITLTNHGTSGSLFASPIINQPQCAILGAGVIQKRVVVIDDAIAIRPMVYLSLTFDHRILDGATADYFLAVVKNTLEGWSGSREQG